MAQQAGYTTIDYYKIALGQRRLIRVVLGSFVLVSAIIAAYYFSYSTTVQPVSPEMESESEFWRGETTYILHEPLVPWWLQIALAAFTVVSCSIVAILWFSRFLMLLFALRMHAIATIITLIGSFVPLVSMLVLAVILGRSWRVLARAGYRVGALGASRRVLDDLKQKMQPPSSSIPEAGFRISPRVE